jgi:hypothetical protein
MVAMIPAAAGHHHPLADLLAEEFAELLGRPRGGRVGLRRQEVPAEFFLGSQTRGGDDVDAGGAGQCLVELEVAAVEHAGAVDDGAAAVVAEVGELAGQDLEDLGPVHGDVRGVLCAREYGQQGLMDRNNAQFGSRDGTQDRIDRLPGGGSNSLAGAGGCGVTHVASPLKFGAECRSAAESGQGRRSVAV